MVFFQLGVSFQILIFSRFVLLYVFLQCFFRGNCKVINRFILEVFYYKFYFRFDVCVVSLFVFICLIICCRKLDILFLNLLQFLRRELRVKDREYNRFTLIGGDAGGRGGRFRGRDGREREVFAVFDGVVSKSELLLLGVYLFLLQRFLLFYGGYRSLFRLYFSLRGYL